MPPAREPADGPDDAVLLRRHAAGDPDAFTELVRRHRDRMWAVALRTLRDPDEAADAVQDALLSAYRGAATFRGDARVSTWLHRITVNACLDRIRRRRARPVPLDDLELPSPGDPVADRETAVEVENALALLPVDQRLAVLLVDVQGLPVAAAARALGIPVGTVKSRCSRGRARLAVLLGHLAPAAGNRSGGAVVTPTGPYDLTDGGADRDRADGSDTDGRHDGPDGEVLGHG